MQEDSETSFYLAANWRTTEPLGRNALFTADGTTRIVVQHGSSEIAVLSWQPDHSLAVDQTILGARQRVGDSRRPLRRQSRAMGFEPDR
ncbi:MAG: hypothetical protein R3C28_10800 [Pirellulaceae bacterium]